MEEPLKLKAPITLLLALSGLMLLAGPVNAPVKAAAIVEASSGPVQNRPGWKSFVLDSPTETVAPKRVIVTRGGDLVENPEGLKEADGRPTTIRSVKRGDARILLDFGQNVGGRVEIGITENTGATVHLAYSEARRYLGPNGDVATFLNLDVTDDPDSRSDDFAGVGDFQSPGIRGAQRWVSLELEEPGTVSIEYVRVRVTHLRPAISDYVGNFFSSDRLLNRIWYGSAYTMHMSTIGDPARPGVWKVVDGAKRDRLVWAGDLAIAAAMANYGARQLPGAIRNSLEGFSCDRDPDGYIGMATSVTATCPEGPTADGVGFMQSRIVALPEYTASWVIALAGYGFSSGDRKFMREMLPVVRGAVDYFHENLRGGVFFTRGPGSLTINWHPFDEAVGVDAHTQAVWYRALGAAALIEREVGDPGRVNSLQSDRSRLKRNALALLWDGSTGAMATNSLNPNGSHSYDAQAEGVMSGLLSGSKADRALDFVDRKLMTRLGPENAESDSDPYMTNYISPFIAGDDLVGRFSRGDTGQALSIIRRLYGHMVTHDPASTMWEKMGSDGLPASYEPVGQQGTTPSDQPNGAGGTSLAHAWSGGAMPALSEFVAGLQRRSLGWKKWRVAPQFGNLEWAQGQVMTPLGGLVSRWERVRRQGLMRLTVIGPAGSGGTVAIPVGGRNRAIARDGKLIWSRGRALPGINARYRDGRVLISQGPGRRTYAWSVR